MCSIADNLTDKELSQLTIGSDEELAFKGAIKRCLPGCTHVLCTSHLKENTNRHMENVVGYPKTNRDEIISDIYGSNGIITPTDIDTYMKLVQNLKKKIEKFDIDVGEKKNHAFL